MTASSLLVRIPAPCCLANAVRGGGMHRMQPTSGLFLRSSATLARRAVAKAAVRGAAAGPAGHVAEKRAGEWTQLASASALVEELRGVQLGRAGPETPVISPPDFPEAPTGPEVPIPAPRTPDTPNAPPEFPGGLPGVEVPSPTIPGPATSPSPGPGPIIGGLGISAISVTPPQPTPGVGPGIGIGSPPFPGNPGNPTPPSQTPPQTPPPQAPPPGGPGSPPFPKDPGSPGGDPAPPPTPGPGTGPGTA